MERDKENSFPKDMGFEVPENYFDQLSKDIESKVKKEKEPKERKLVPTWVTISLAAAILITFSIWWMNYTPTPSTLDTEWSVENIVLSGELDEYALEENEAVLAALNDSELPIENDISEEAITEYLLSEDLSEYDIYNYLKNN